ncbi:UNVERIFIED_CONTAM: hypothetical protein Sradi_5964700 [Sesamum radiatum]|uniref:Uncharacterized protein n=1 Tax=Sesamum radiatum TaxID=300843 RepID=A0AAW2KEV6_SESRA
MDDQYPDEEEEGENKRGPTNSGVRGGGVDLGGGVGRVRSAEQGGGVAAEGGGQLYCGTPPMNNPFPDTPKQLSDEKRSSTGGSDHLGFDSAEVDMDGGGADPNYSHQQVTKSSACSSTSETSKGSGLSLSRSESRIKARERAKERAVVLYSYGLLYFWASRAIGSSSRSNAIGKPICTGASPLFSVTGEHQPELQHFSLSQTTLSQLSMLLPEGTEAATITIIMGTLQSNSSSPSLLPHLQRFPDGSPPSFFIGTAASVENHHQFLSGYDARLQLCYGDAHANNAAGIPARKEKEKTEFIQRASSFETTSSFLALPLGANHILSTLSTVLSFMILAWMPANRDQLVVSLFGSLVSNMSMAEPGVAL